MPRHQARGGERQPRQRLLQDDEIARDANDNGQIVSRQRVSDEVRRRREHFVAVALDCCPRWWISSADRPLQHAEHDGATVSRHDEFSDGRACAPSHRSSSAWSLEHDQDNIDCAGLSEEGAHTPASSWQNSTTFHTYTFKGPIEGLSNSQSILPAAHKAQAQGQGGMGERACCSEELRRARCGKGGWLGTGFTKSFTHTHKRGQCALLLIALVQFALWQPTGSWIALSKEGYTIKHNLIAEAGIQVTGDLRVNGVLMSKPIDNIECTPDRAGSMRWNDKFFESCDGVTDWQPIQFCDRSCAVNADAVPCGVAVLNKCGISCDQTGTGLNMRQCLLKTSTTACNTEVVDNCNNPCGILGQFDCDSKEITYGGVVIKSLDDAPSTAGFEFTVGADRSPQNKDSLFMTYKNMGGISQALTMIRRLNEGSGGATGMEFAKPPGQHDATMRVSMLTELTGELIQLGRNVGQSQLFVDGVVDKECPLVFNGGVHDGNVTKLCLETPTEQRTLTFPDASGTVITSGNREDVTNLPGLQGDNTLVYTGSYRDLRDIALPPKPRVSCHNFECHTSNVTFPDGVLHDTGCEGLAYENHFFDAFRVYYLLDDGRCVCVYVCVCVCVCVSNI